MFINQRNMDSVEVEAIVALVSVALTYLGIQIHPAVNGAVSGVFAIIALIAGFERGIRAAKRTAPRLG